MAKEKNLELERLVFFSDAVVAIAITLLALNLRIDKAPGYIHFRFSDISNSWRQFASFLLSFILITIFWLVHHKFFHFIVRIDRTLAWYNMLWLLFIVMLPFSATLVSADFDGHVALFVYSLNIFFITLFQNQIWDHVAVRPDYLILGYDPDEINDNRVYCNIAMFNALFAMGISFISPLISFILLSLRPLMKFLYDKLWGKYKKRKSS
jgi:uncharacterized membrane protein